MRIYINDVCVQVTSDQADIDTEKFDFILDAKKDKLNDAIYSNPEVLILRPDEAQLISVLEKVASLKPKANGLKKLHLLVFKPKTIKESLKERYGYLKLSGALIKRGNRFLLIFENNKWGFPKGKLDKSETHKEAALREVKEETSLDIKLVSKLANSYRLLKREQFILKRYRWYLMSSENNTQLIPSLLEGIKKGKWFTRSEIVRLNEELVPYVEDVLEEYDTYISKQMQK